VKRFFFSRFNLARYRLNVAVVVAVASQRSVSRIPVR
jgi:hypothetical protein